MTDRFNEWKKPKIKHGELTKWNWMVQYPEGLVLGNRVDIGAFCYLHSKHGLHVTDSDHTTAPSSKQQLRSKHLGNVCQIRDGLIQAHRTGRGQYIAATSHDHMTKHGYSNAPAQETLERVGRAARSYVTGTQSRINRAVGRGAKKAGKKAKKLLTDIFKEDTENLTEVEKLQLYMAISKAEKEVTEKEKDEMLV